MSGLARREARYHIPSLERPQDVAHADAVANVREDLDRVGVEWTPLAYEPRGSWRTALGNVARLIRSADAQGRAADVVHARGCHSAFAGLVGPRLLTGRPPLLFDTRAYWFDERREQGCWFDRDLVFGGVKRVERAMYARSSEIVTLNVQVVPNDMNGSGWIG